MAYGIVGGVVLLVLVVFLVIRLRMGLRFVKPGAATPDEIYTTHS